MKNITIYSKDDITKTYEHVHDHLLTRYIIRNYSSNRNDIRDVALHGLNLKRVKKVLDIGCGYGFFIEKLKGILHESAVIVGIDLVENNREPFLHSVDSIQYRGEFITSNADIIQKMPNSMFDLVITSYSLYFFPHLINDIARILVSHGIFIALTHSKDSLQEVIQSASNCMDSVGIRKEQIMLNKLFLTFSQENGDFLLKEYFKTIERLDFDNKIIFPYSNIEDCIFYINNKRNLIYKEVLEIMPEKMKEVQKCVESHIIDYSKANDMYTLNKNDAVFRCYAPTPSPQIY